MSNGLRSPAAGAAFALLALSALPAATPASAEPKIGQPAPDFTAKDTKGADVRLSAFKGKTVVLEWTNHDCPYVGKHYGSGNMQALQKDATAKGTVWLTVVSSASGTQGHVDGGAADQLTQTRRAAPSAVLLDPKGVVGRLYDARTTPHMFVIDKSGTLAYMGAIDDKPTSNKADVATARSYVREALVALEKGVAVPTATTRPYGCSVKY